jgi:putative ABC transport system substrate-binding protein
MCLWPLAAFPLKRATRTVPIVVFSRHGAAQAGLIASYARPGGNTIGVESLAPGLDGKRLDLLRATLSQARTVALLSNPSDPATALHHRWLHGAAERLRLSLAMVSVSSPADLDSAFAAVFTIRAHAVLVFSDAILVDAGAQIATWSLEAGLPPFAELGPYPRAGGLMSYGASLDDMARRVAVYIDRILRGAKPADMPLERASTFEMVIDMKTAKTSSITLAQSITLLADEVNQ